MKGSRSSKTKLSILIWMSQIVFGCSLEDAIPIQDTKVKVIVVPASEEKEPENIDREPPLMQGPRFVRRLTLDLALRLPKPHEVDGFGTQESAKQDLVASLIRGSGAALAIASLHTRMWHLNYDDLPDLDEIAATDSVFKTQLGDVRSELLSEPILRVRKVLEDRMPFVDIFTGNFAIMSAKSRDFWGQTVRDDGGAFAGEPYRYVTFRDQRPEAGVLSGPGFLSAFAGRRENVQTHRMARILAELTCRTMEGPQAHLFHDLKDEAFTGPLSSIATSQKTCAGCHQLIAGGGVGLSGLANGSTFDEWKTYTSPSALDVGRYNSASVSNLKDLADAIRSDPQVLRCESEKLTSALLQRRFALSDQAIPARIHDALKLNPDLLEALGVLLLSKPYAYAPSVPQVKGAYVRLASGVRLLRRHHFESMIRDWAPELSQEALDMALDPGVEEDLGSDDMMPTGPYWHAIDKIARKLAHAVVNHDLVNGRLAEDRYLLSTLNPGLGLGSTQATVNQQIIDLWYSLTSFKIENGSELLSQFQNLWNSAGSLTDASQFKTAWSLVLVAMFTHPSFITY